MKHGNNVTHINRKQASNFLKQALETLSHCGSEVFSYVASETMKQGDR